MMAHSIKDRIMVTDLTLESESTLTDRYQTTVPEMIRKALRLSKRDKIHYKINKDGQVILSRAQSDNKDPALDYFLNFIARDISENPERIEALGTGLVARIKKLTADVEIDLDAQLTLEDE
jgi:antitoxin PrlF